jgi:hypothetical protein
MSALLLLVAVACQYYAVKKLEHGLPVARRGLVNPDMQAIDDEPVLLTDSRITGISIHNLGLQQPQQQLQQRRLAPSACYYEVTLSGFGLDVEGAVHVYSARHLITPFHFGLRDPDRSSSSASDQQKHHQEGAGAQPRARGGIVVRSVDTGTQAVSSSSAEGVHTPRVEMSVRGPEEAYLELFAAADVVTSTMSLSSPMASSPPSGSGSGSDDASRSQQQGQQQHQGQRQQGQQQGQQQQRWPELEELELLVDVRRVGRGCQAPQIQSISHG